MADKSKIQWTDATWSPVVGCSKVSTGCQNCYAEKMMYRQVCMGCARHEKNPNGDENAWEAYSAVMDEDTHKWNGSIALRPEILEIPLRWKRPRKIFVCSMSDLFHPSVPFEFIDKVVEVFVKCPQHTGILLTKRAERLYEYSEYRAFNWPGNIIGMVTAENQPMADLRIPYLLQCGFKTTGVSIEPILGPVDISEFEEEEWRCDGCNEFYSHFQDTTCNHCGYAERHSEYRNQLSWVIVGAETGPKKRPCRIEDILNIVEQCRATGVPVFVKNPDIGIHEFPGSEAE